MNLKKIYIEEFSKVSYYKDVVSYAHSLKNKCKIGILSDLTIFDKSRIDMQYELKQFDYVYLSFELGMRKDSTNIYEYVTDDLNINPKYILFIDDDINNIKRAKSCWWNICLARGVNDKIIKSVDKFLNDIEIYYLLGLIIIL